MDDPKNKGENEGAKAPQKIQTYLGFPVAHPEEDSASQRGIAIIITLFMITLMMIFMADMQVNTIVQGELSTASRDNIKAEYLAKSGANLATFLVTADLALDLTLAAPPVNAPASDSAADIWGKLNGIPLGGETIEMMEQVQEDFDISKINGKDVLDKLKLFDGSFSFVVSDESSKFNINYCGGYQKASKLCRDVLNAMFSGAAEREFMERRKQNPKELIGDITDWIDNNTEPDPESARGSESDPYQNRLPKVEPKNSYFDSLDELRVVAGWDNTLHNIFSPYLTVYPVPELKIGDSTSVGMLINFNSASRELLNSIFPEATTVCAEQSALYMESRADGEPASSLDAVKKTLKVNFCADEEMTKFFTYRSDVYRVSVQGTSGGQTKTLEYVVERQNPVGPDTQNQSKASYKYLYWKML